MEKNYSIAKATTASGIVARWKVAVGVSGERGVTVLPVILKDGKSWLRPRPVALA